MVAEITLECMNVRLEDLVIIDNSIERYDKFHGSKVNSEQRLEIHR